MKQFQVSYPNTFDPGKIYHVSRGNSYDAFFSTNYKSNAMRKIRRVCAQNPGCLFVLIDTLCPPAYSWHYIDGREVKK